MGVFHINKKYDITGQTFGYLTVLRWDESSLGQRNSKWICKCKCGNETSVTRSALVSGRSTSCGCKAFESHNKTHGFSKTRIYRTWVQMRGRCRRDTGADAKDYHDRGITVCEEWNSDFVSFYTWAMANGYEDTLTIDRIDNSKGYSPENCRWITATEQQSNKRSNITVNYNGEVYCLSHLCEKVGFPYKTAHRRYTRLTKRGVPIDVKALIAPIEEKKIAKRYRSE